ncbi:MAG: fasciclin domain-containing protein [Pacificimonas sp.]|jgi:uncharacterized surface protein with fasciclin (FAS1) repeats|nr:fasciclin domain-containing protein [Pacificimonas sp.]
MKPIFAAASAALLAATPLAAAHHAGGHDAPGTIVEVASGNDSFDTLIAAVTAADLAATLSSDGPFTVFAPTDEAFAKLPAGTVDMLLEPENKAKLVEILTYHVVPGKVMSTDLAGNQLSAATVEGSEIAIDATNGVMVNDATVVMADVAASNGVIHVIDTVLMPPSD